MFSMKLKSTVILGLLVIVSFSINAEEKNKPCNAAVEKCVQTKTVKNTARKPQRVFQVSTRPEVMATLLSNPKKVEVIDPGKKEVLTPPAHESEPQAIRVEPIPDGN